MTLEIGDDVQIKVGNLMGQVGRILARQADGRLGVSLDGAAPKFYGERSLRLVKAAAHIRKGDHVVRKSEPDGPIGVVVSRGAMRAQVSWNGLQPLGMDIRTIDRIAKRSGPIVRDQCWCATAEAPHVHGPIDKAAILARPTDSLLDSGVRTVKYVRCRWCPTLSNPNDIGAHEATHVKGLTGGPVVEARPVVRQPPERPEGRMYPIGRPESGEDARFKAGLWMDLVRGIEAAGFPMLGNQDLARLQGMLFRFIYDDGE